MFQNKKVEYIKYIIIDYISIDGKKFYNKPIVYLNLNDIDIIVERKWFEAIETLIDPTNKQIIWPDLRLSAYNTLLNILINLTDFYLNEQY